MADTEAAPVFDPTAKKKKSRKSVAFSEEDAANGLNGGATATGEDKSTAESHSVDAGDAAPAAEGDDLFKGLKKKKKSSKDKEPKEDDEAAAGGDGEFGLKKKKKRKSPAVGSFDAKLAEAGIAPTDGESAEGVPAAAPEPVSPADAGDPIAGTGVWASTSEASVTYPLLLSRFFTLLRAQHPDLAADGRLKAYKIPPPQVLREGNRKSIFANISEICKKMKRQDDHVTQFLFAELGTSGSVDGSKRLVIKGRFQQKQLENVLRRYILEYVTCRTCKSPDTELKKGENRLYFVTCNSCGSRRSVTAIKTGFQATVGKRRRQQA